MKRELKLSGFDEQANGSNSRAGFLAKKGNLSF